MNPGAHGEFGDKDVAAFGKQDGSFRGYHFDFRIGFHDLLDARERQLMNLVIMGVALKM